MRSCKWFKGKEKCQQVRARLGRPKDELPEGRQSREFFVSYPEFFHSFQKKQSDHPIQEGRKEGRT
jgi:hypothetical protein